VKPLTALHEVILLSAVLAEAGLQKPDLGAINASAKKLGAPRAKKAQSPKTPLTMTHMEAMWCSPLIAAPIDLRNMAMLTLGFFFLLRGINVRELKLKDLTQDKTTGSWKVFIDHQKNDPLILGQAGTAQGAIQWAGNRLMDEVLHAWIKASHPKEEELLFPQAKLTGSKLISWRGRDERFDPAAGLTSAQHVNVWLKKTLKALFPSDDVSRISFHSCRVGGASAIFAATHNEALKKMGNWRSEAFRTYIAIATQDMIESTLALGKAASGVPVQGEPELLIE
jgi:hypothetical protein